MQIFLPSAQHFLQRGHGRDGPVAAGGDAGRLVGQGHDPLQLRDTQSIQGAQLSQLGQGRAEKKVSPAPLVSPTLQGTPGLASNRGMPCSFTPLWVRSIRISPTAVISTIMITSVSKLLSLDFAHLLFDQRLDRGRVAGYKAVPRDENPHILHTQKHQHML